MAVDLPHLTGLSGPDAVRLRQIFLAQERQRLKLADENDALVSRVTELEADVSTVGGFHARSVPYRRVNRTSTVSIPNNVQTTVGWQNPGGLVVETADSGISFTAGGVVTLAVAGIYLLNVTVTWASNVNGQRSIVFKRNGTEQLGGDESDPGQVGAFYHSTSVLHEFSEGDTVEVQLHQNSGGALNWIGNNENRFTIAWIGPWP